MTHKPFFKLLICLFLLTAIAGCSNADKFDRQKWSYGNGLDYPLRNEVLDDLLKNHHIKGLNYRQVIDSLGAPQQRAPLLFTYQIQDNSYEYNRKKPIHQKSLLVYFSKDSIVIKTVVYDHTAKK